MAPPAAEYLPALQLEQVSRVLAPTAPENLPAAQFTQAVVPVKFVAMYLPAAQGVQAEAPSPEYVPAAQSSPQTGAPSAEYLPAAQSEQVSLAVAPPAAEYLPAAQLVQAVAPEVSEYVPAKHQRVISLRESSRVAFDARASGRETCSTWGASAIHWTSVSCLAIRVL